MKIKTAIAEDNSRLAESLIEKLSLFKNEIEFVFLAVNGEELNKMLSENHSVDVILMDIEMPLLDGIEATKLVKKNYPNIKVIMLTVFDDEARIFNSIMAGASGYLLKDEPPQKIIEGIKMIIDGGAPMSPSIAFKALNLLRDPNRINNQDDKEAFSLSTREVDVLEQICTGLDYQKIAENLFISPFTVRKHIENIYKKLQVHNKVEAIQKAKKHNLI